MNTRYDLLTTNPCANSLIYEYKYKPSPIDPVAVNVVPASTNLSILYTVPAGRAVAYHNPFGLEIIIESHIVRARGVQQFFTVVFAAAAAAAVCRRPQYNNV